MLTKMFFESADYDEVLKEAQEKGYAERNPEEMSRDMMRVERLRF